MGARLRPIAITTAPRVARVTRAAAQPVVERDFIAAAEASSHLELVPSLSAVAILAQARSMLVDLLELTGLGPDEARELVPDLD